MEKLTYFEAMKRSCFLSRKIISSGPVKQTKNFFLLLKQCMCLVLELECKFKKN